MGRLIYKPYVPYLIADILVLVVSVVVVLAWFPLSTEVPFQKYSIYMCVFSAVWLLASYACHRYVPVKYMKMGQDIFRLTVAAAGVFGVMCGYMWLYEGRNFSLWVLLTI